jgi:NADH-quinone oxidoreductase subunit H
MAEYGSMFVVSGLAAILFFGGWHGPIPVFEAWAYEPGEAFRITGYLADLAGCLNFVLKSTIGVTVMMWVRWTLPRLRIDQVIGMCWKYCVPIAAVCFVGAWAGWQYFGPPSPNDWFPATRRTEVREHWVVLDDDRPLPIAAPAPSVPGGGRPESVLARSGRGVGAEMGQSRRVVR